MEHDKSNTVKLDSVTCDHDSHGGPSPSPLNRPGTGGPGVRLLIRVGFLVLCTVGYATPAAAAQVVMQPGPEPARIMIRVIETAVASRVTVTVTGQARSHSPSPRLRVSLAAAAARGRQCAAAGLVTVLAPASLSGPRLRRRASLPVSRPGLSARRPASELD
jgi:hypothetical protein